MRFLATLTLCTLSVGTAFSQSELLPKGESGLGVSSALFASRLATTYGVGAGYSFKGVLDLGVSLGKVNVTRASTGETIPTKRGTFASPSITWYFLRQEEDVDDVSIGVTAAYEYVSYKVSGAPTEKEHIYSGGFTLFQDVVHSSQFKLLPTLNLAVVRSKTTEVLALVDVFFGVKEWLGQISGLTLTVGYQTGTVTTGVGIAVVL